MSQPKRILCVCLGNICRSPTAEVVLKSLCQKAGLLVDVDSAGTSNYHIGHAPDSRSISHAKAHGYDLTPLRARQLSCIDFEMFDLILAMDQQNLHEINAVKRQCTHTPIRAQVALFTHHLVANGIYDVIDPYYEEGPAFEQVITVCEQAATAWIQHWMKC